MKKIKKIIYSISCIKYQNNFFVHQTSYKINKLPNIVKFCHAFLMLYFYVMYLILTDQTHLQDACYLYRLTFQRIFNMLFTIYL